MWFKSETKVTVTPKATLVVKKIKMVDTNAIYGVLVGDGKEVYVYLNQIDDSKYQSLKFHISRDGAILFVKEHEAELTSGVPLVSPYPRDILTLCVCDEKTNGLFIPQKIMTAILEKRDYYKQNGKVPTEKEILEEKTIEDRKDKYQVLITYNNNAVPRGGEYSSQVVDRKTAEKWLGVIHKAVNNNESFIKVNKFGENEPTNLSLSNIHEYEIVSCDYYSTKFKRFFDEYWSMK